MSNTAQLAALPVLTTAEQIAFDCICRAFQDEQCMTQERIDEVTKAAIYFAACVRDEDLNRKRVIAHVTAMFPAAVLS